MMDDAPPSLSSKMDEVNNNLKVITSMLQAILNRLPVNTTPPPPPPVVQDWDNTKSLALLDMVANLAQSNRPASPTAPKVDSVKTTLTLISSPAIPRRSLITFGRPRSMLSSNSVIKVSETQSAEVSAEEHRVVKPEPAKEKPTSALSCVKHSNLVHGTTTPEALVFCINVLTTNFILFPIASMVLNICHHHYMLRVCQKDMRTPEIDWGRIIIKST
jgi:hypothetical protein